MKDRNYFLNLRNGITIMAMLAIILSSIIRITEQESGFVLTLNLASLWLAILVIGATVYDYYTTNKNNKTNN